MKRAMFLTVLVGLLAIGALAQEKTTNFTGSWTLDTGKSKLAERMRVESVTMTVTQSDNELKVETVTKRAQPPQNTGGGMGGMRFGGGMGGDGTFTYSLDGKETSIQQETPRGTIPVTLKAKFEKDGRLKLTSTRNIETPMGAMSLATRETWTLSADGQTLTVKRETDSPRGAISSELVFTKN